VLTEIRRLRDGRTIRTVSALLLQLVQTSAHDVRIKAMDIAKERQNKFALRRQESFSESQSQGNVVEEFLDEQDTAVGPSWEFWCSGLLIWSY
jgi:cohesin loading factor subunit SCC2